MKVPEQFKIALKALKLLHPELLNIIGAQWCLESDFGRSDLAKKACNFSGLGYRDLAPFLHKNILERVGMYQYTGQDGDTKEYLKCYMPVDFAHVYLAFLRREVYNTPEIKVGELLQSPLALLGWIADQGFCGWVPGVKRKDYQTDEDYQQATHAEYVRSVLECSLSTNYQKLLREL